MTLYYAADIAAGWSDYAAKNIWRQVERLGIQPQRNGKKFALSETQVKELEAAASITIPRKRATVAPAQQGRPLTHKPSPRQPIKGKATSWDIVPMGPKRTVSEATLAANRRRIEEQQARRVQPVHVAAGDVPRPWQWSRGL